MIIITLNLLILIFLSSIIYMFFIKDKFVKLMILNYLSGIIILIIAIESLTPHKYYYVDIAIIYIILSFIASLGYLKFFDNEAKDERKD